MCLVLDQHNLFYEGNCIMESIRQYILSVICVAVVCGVLQMLLAEGTAAALVRIISGLIVTITVLSPVVDENLLQWSVRFDHIMSDVDMAVTEGQTTASDLLKQRILKDTETYILTKAADLGASISVSVTLASDYPNAPESVIIKGEVSPYAKKQLEAYLAKDMGILEENQIWML